MNVLTPVIHSIAEVTAYIKSRFEEDELLRDVWLTGEVSNFKQHTSGHCYLTLKDETTSIRAIIWRTAAARMSLPRDGDAVIVRGYISVYEPQGVYQLYINHLEPTGLGRLWVEFERLRTRLLEEGLFDEARKRPLPGLPVRIGVVTSPTGAALRDILRTLAARFSLLEVIIAPAVVQGDAAPSSIVAAIRMLNRWMAEYGRLDAIILARGGGSIEELWAFNDERVARAVGESLVPIVTGVGHETDFTIVDFVADSRAPTPTGAAMLIAPDARELRDIVGGLAAIATARMADRLAVHRTNHEMLARRLERSSPALRLAADRQRVDDLTRRSELAITHRLATLGERLAGQSPRLMALHPQKVLARGYAIVTKLPEGDVVTMTHQVKRGDALRVRVSDGSFMADVVEENRSSTEK
jgi:exodeoxyribonuclease VII large subunit